MKKYWKSAVTILVVVLSIGSFYISSAKSAVEQPNFVIEPISGDFPEIKPVVLEGFYSDQYSDVSHLLSIDAEGSTYRSQSFLNQLSGNPSPSIKKLRKEHRNFMRGKVAADIYFFEDEQYLAYAGVNYDSSLRTREFKLDVAVMNKKSGQTDSFYIDVPSDKQIEYMYVEDVQLIDNALYVVTHNRTRNEHSYFEEKMIYTIDVDNQKLANHEVLLKIPARENNHYFNMHVIRSNPTAAMDQLLLAKNEIKVIEEGENYQEEVVSKEIISYNLTTKEKTTLNLPDMHYDNYLSFFNGSTVYFSSLDEQGLQVTPYQVAEEKVGASYRIDLPIKDSHMMTIKDGKLYITYSQKGKKSSEAVVVADAKTGEILFKGQVVLEDPAERQGGYNLYIHDLFVD